MADDFPFVSFVIPTYNAARMLPRCLASIRKQRYPLQRYEILVADGFSEDRTSEVAKAFGASIVWNERRDAQIGKACGIAAASGEFIALLDADNEIVQDDWLTRLLRPLRRHPEVMGVESDLLIPSGDYWVNRYCSLLRLEDPISRRLGLLRQHVRVRWEGQYAILSIKPERTAVFGANGFLWRRSVLLSAPGVFESFDEADVAAWMVNNGRRTLAAVPGCGIYHHHIRSVGQFWRKRLRTDSEFLVRRRRKTSVWTDRIGRFRRLGAVLHVATLVPTLLESIDGFRRQRDTAWLAHAPLSFGSVAIYVFCVAFTALCQKDPQRFLQDIRNGGNPA